MRAARQRAAWRNKTTRIMSSAEYRSRGQKKMDPEDKMCAFSLSQSQNESGGYQKSDISEGPVIVKKVPSWDM